MYSIGAMKIETKIYKDMLQVNYISKDELLYTHLKPNQEVNHGV